MVRVLLEICMPFCFAHCVCNGDWWLATGNTHDWVSKHRCSNLISSLKEGSDLHQMLRKLPHWPVKIQFDTFGQFRVLFFYFYFILLHFIRNLPFICCILYKVIQVVCNCPAIRSSKYPIFSSAFHCQSQCTARLYI